MGRYLCGFVLLVACNGTIGAVDDPVDVPPPLPEPEVEPLEPIVAGLRAMTPPQYEASVREVLALGDDVLSLGEEGEIELAVGEWGTSIAAARGGFSATDVISYEAAALEITEYVFADEARRARVVGCEPSAACTAETLAQVGMLAYRRTLTADELSRWVHTAAEVESIFEEGVDPYIGLQFAIAGMLQSPGFLYRHEFGQPSGDRLVYTDIEMATRLAFLIWNRGPDAELIEIAETGGLASEGQIMAQVRTMLADPRAEAGIRGFLTELLDADSIAELERTDDYPEFDEEMALAMRAQLVQTAISGMKEGGFPGLFTTQAVWLDDELAPLYEREPDVGEHLVLEPSDPLRAGVLTTPGYLALHSYPGYTSPALRGLFVRSRLLCESIAPPPAGVDTAPPEGSAERLPTARARAADHQTNEVCAGCHVLMDPIGLSLEEFDAIGRHRTTENGVRIDATGNLDGQSYDEATGLGRAVAEHPKLLPCMVATLYAYGAANTVQTGDPGIQRMNDALTAPTIEEAILAIATDDLFRYAHREETE